MTSIIPVALRGLLLGASATLPPALMLETSDMESESSWSSAMVSKEGVFQPIAEEKEGTELREFTVEFMRCLSAAEEIFFLCFVGIGVAMVLLTPPEACPGVGGIMPRRRLRADW